MPKGSAPRKQVSKTRAVNGGAQQWVRGKTHADRVTTVYNATLNTKNPKAQQMLTRALKDAMSPKARSYSSQKAEMKKLRALADGRIRESIHRQVAGPNAAAASALNRIRLKK